MDLRLSIEFDCGHLTLLCCVCFGICAFEMEQVVSDEECKRFGENARDERGSVAVNKAEKILSYESDGLFSGSLKLIDDKEDESVLELHLISSDFFGIFVCEMRNLSEELLLE